MKKTIVGVVSVAALFLLIWIGLVLAGRAFLQPGLLGGREYALLHSPSGDSEVVATIDTGASVSSIDEGLALSLGFSAEPGEKRRIVTDQGAVERDIIRIDYRLGDQEISSIATLADRSALNTKMLIGRSDLGGFNVDATREFLATLGTQPARYLQNPGMFLGGGRLGQVLIVLPVLAAVVVVLRLLVGMRTYGVFAPTIVAVSLLDVGLAAGTLVYVLLLAIGMSARMLVLRHLRLPRIAEFALVMALLVVLLAAIAAVPGGILSPGSAFFPLIITTHLIEQASRGIEDHSLSEALSLLGSTLSAALLLAVLGQVLLGQSLTVLWALFGLSIGVTILAGNYLGIRLTELLRFKFLRRTHVH